MTMIPDPKEQPGSVQRVVRVRRIRRCFVAIGILSLITTRVSEGRVSQSLAMLLVMVSILALYLWSED